MIVFNTMSRRHVSRIILALPILVGALLQPMDGSPALAQAAEPEPPAAEATAVPKEAQPDANPVALAEAALAAEEPKMPAATSPEPVSAGQINLLDLLVKGGYLMIPIGVMSLIVVTFGLERWLGLRRRRVLPPRLIRGINQAVVDPDGFDPRKAYDLCQAYPSAAGRVIKAMLLKVGRPHAEVERAVRDAAQREADRLYTNVRWLSLAAGVAPLLGLLGTVWGMIQAFFATANLPTGANKGEILAQGIYVALVTTFAGLAVAIPAAVLAHLFEGRVQKLFRRLDETLIGLLSELERFEGKLRVRHEPIVPGGKDAYKVGEENMTLRMYRNPK